MPSASKPVIVGLGCVLPEARSPEEFWVLLVSRRSALKSLPRERFDMEALASELPAHLDSSPNAGLIADVELRFDALRLPPLQLEQLHRMEKAALAAMIQALSDAHVAPGSQVGKRTKVFVGATTMGADSRTDQRRRIYRFEFAAPIAASLSEVVPDRVEELRALIQEGFEQSAPPVILDSLATSASLVAGRICNTYDLQGGHLVVDAGGTSSMAALDLAAASLANDECDTALVCAISPMLSASRVLTLLNSEGLDVAPSPGEGCVAIVLVRDPQPGPGRRYATLEGICARFVGAQEDLRQAVVRAATDARHRAGVEVGSVDAIERTTGVDAAVLEALRDVYGSPNRGALPVTSSADNVGYLDSAAGLLGVMKACLALERQTWPGGPGASVERAAVSDVGQSPVVYQALLARTGRAEAVQVPAKRRRLADEGIAITGVGVVVPGADNTPAFWRNVLAGVDAITDLPPERWDVDGLTEGSTELRALLQTRLAGVVDLPAVLERAAAITEQAEEDLEPGAALGLVACTEALQDARFRKGEASPGRVAVILGQLPIRPWESQAEVRIVFLEYLHRAMSVLRQAGLGEPIVQRVRLRALAINEYAASTGARFDPSVFSGIGTPALVARTHGFQGTVLSVDAACASSLAALEIGCNKLLAGEADLVVAGGVAFNLLPEYYIGLSMLGVLSRYGATPFHVGADGFVPAEGAGAVVLKRLSDARNAKDRVYGVIRGVGISSDGRGPSIFVPSTEAQQRAMVQALAESGLEPDQIDLVEAHGVGTEAGDTAEAASYRAVYGQRNRTLPLFIGTTKEHIGYLSCAGPAVSLVKLALALREQMLPTGALGDDGQALMLPEDSLRLLRSARPWTAPPFRRRRAAISGIGLGGINYHVILEEPDQALRLAGDDARRASPPAVSHRASRWSTELAPVTLSADHPPLSVADAHLLLIRDRESAWVEVARALERRGAKITSVEPNEHSAAVGDLDGIIDLSELWSGDARNASMPDEVLRTASTTFDVLRAVYPRLADSSRRSWYAAAVSLGGDLGLSGASANPLGARFVGLARALRRELPWLTARVIDFGPGLNAAMLADTLMTELESGDPEVAVAYSAGRRRVPRFRLLQQSSADSQSPWLPESTRCLMSGGGRGVLFHCAVGLCRLGAKVVVSGRTRRPPPDAPWLQLDDRAFADYRREEMLQAWRRDRMTPVQFQAAFGEIERQRELHRNLELARGLGLALDYEECDVTDRHQVEQLAAATRARWGGVDLVVHGAMVERSVALPQKTPELIASTFATKVGGLMNLLDATRADAPRFICFGSVAGVFGNAGQTDYAAADTLMSAVLASQSQSPRGYASINWPAWRRSGAAAADAEIEARIQAAGVTAIWPDEGVHWFLQEVVVGGSEQVAIVDEDMLNRWAWDNDGIRRVDLDDTGRPLLAGRWPMVDQVEKPSANEVVVRRTLDPSHDRFLLQHRLRGVPTLPFIFACELLAEAAQLACPGFTVVALHDIRVESPIKLFGLKPMDVAVRVSIVETNADAREANVVLASDLRVGDRVASDARVHYIARVSLARQRPELAADPVLRDEPVGGGGFIRSRSFFHLMNDPILLGSMFDRAAWLRASETGVTGTVRPRRHREVLSRSASPGFVLDPFGIDAALQIGASWDGYQHGWLSVPLAIERLQLGPLWQPTDRIRVAATIVECGSHDVVYDIVGVGDDNRVLFKIDRLRQRRFAQADAKSH